MDILTIITNASRAFDGEPCRPHLPYVTFAEVIWGEQRVQEIWKRYRGCFFPLFFGWGSRVALLQSLSARTPVFSRAFTHGNIEWTDILTEGEAKISSKQRALGGQTLVEVVVCAVGWVVILPLVEMTAQSTALLALANYDGGVKQDQLFVNRINWMGRNVHS